MYQWCGPPLSVLVVEDGATNRLLLQTLLHRLGHSVLLAEHGGEALDVLQRQAAPDLILMDLQMPVMDGLQATRAIRAMPGPAAKLPIVAVTANVAEGAREMCLDAGMDEYLPKPVTPMSLLHMLRRCFCGETAAAAEPSSADPS